jgi:hypothetical protein
MDFIKEIKTGNRFSARYVFTEQEVSKYLDIILQILPELPRTDARHIAEHCHMRCYDSSVEPTHDFVHESINQFYEVFNLPNQLILGDPSY